ncbi:MAG: Flp family type IVb pilin [Firmicutes bacterium]|nr:Flp family type IVb pilin [Bacillota bacterium]
MKLVKLISRLINEEKGGSAIEYGLIIALIATVVIGILLALGGNDRFFGTITDSVNNSGI